jgi:hypothetical protein
VAQKSTAEQTFRSIFNLWVDENTPREERDVAGRKMDAWLRRRGKSRVDISSILAEAERDDAATNPSTPPPNPRASAPHPFDDPKYNPANLVEDVVRKYVAMRPHVRVIFVLSIIFSHFYTRFRIAPRIALVSEDPDSGKTTALEVARSLAFRSNEEALGTVAAIRRFLKQGPATIVLDEIDLIDAAVRKALLLLWNLGHAQGARHALMSGNNRDVIDLHAPMITAGLGSFLGRAQFTRTLVLRMYPFDEGSGPPRDWWAPSNEEEDPTDTAEARKAELSVLYAYLGHFAATRKPNLRPPIPPGIIRRSADNVRGLFAMADLCGDEWPRRLRKALTILFGEMKAELPNLVILRHGLAIFDMLSIDEIEINKFNRELRRLDLPGINWSQYRGASGLESYARPIDMNQQGRLLASVGVKSHPAWPPGPRRAGTGFRIYERAEFQEALRRELRRAGASKPSAPPLRLVEPSE